jgi:peptidoglycan hydrolase-like protein with peptidoglycan-binding domain
VITSVLPTGTSVRLGSVLYTVESRPVVALAGALPAWRGLSLGVTDGADVAQLELSLVALGYDRSHTITVDNHFDNNTKAAVERWQAGYGIDVTGVVTLGSVVFLPSPTTVSAVSVKVGSAVGDGDSIMSLAASSQQVVITVPAGDEAVVVPGLTVGIGTLTGTVTLLRSATQNGSTVVEAVITPAATIPNVDNGASVKVHITQDHMPNVLLAPAVALVSRIDGSYALQVLSADGSVSWHTVEVLGVSGADVAVRGDGITNGTQVLQPL